MAVDISYLNQPGANQSDDTEWSDYPKAAYGALQGLSGAAQSGIAYIADNVGEPETGDLIRGRAALQHRDEQDTIASMTPAAQKSMNSNITGSDFWEHPGRALGLKGAQMSPALIASALPAGIVAEAFGAAAGTGMAIASNAGLSATQYVDAVSSKIADASDDDLRKDSALYNGLRDRMTEEDARRELTHFVTDGDGRLALTALAGGVAGGAGLGGMMARGSVLTGTALRRAAFGLGEAGGAGALQTGVGDYAEQQAGLEAGTQKEFDARGWLNRTLEAGALTGLPGAAHGLMHAAPEAIPKPRPDAPTVVPEVGLDPAQADAVEARNPPPGDTPPPAGQPAQVTPQAPPEATPEITPVTESPETIQAQQQATQEQKRPAVVYPKGTDKPSKPPEGLKRTNIRGDIYDYDPEQTSPKDLRAKIKDGSVGEFLGYGDTTQEEAVQRAASGETPVAVTERTPDGTEVKAAAGTDRTAPDQTQALEANKAAPENTVQVESPAQVIADRQEAQAPAPQEPAAKPSFPGGPGDKEPPRKPQVLRDVTPEGKKADATNQKAWNKKIAANKETAPKEPKGKNRDKDEKAARTQNNATAEDIINGKHLPTDAEANYFDGRAKGANDARKAILARAQAMVDAAKEKGVEIPATIRDNLDELMNHSPATMLLAEARSLVGKKVKKGADFQRFIGREKDLREGNVEAVKGERRAEGDIAKRTDQGDVSAPLGNVADALADHNTPEAALEAKEHAEESHNEATVLHNFEKRLAEAAVRSAPDLLSPEALARIEKARRYAMEGKTEGERAAGQAAIERIVEKVASTRVTAGEDKAGTFKVETKRKSWQPGKKSLPEVGSKPWKVGPKDVTSEGIKALERPDEPATVLGPEGKAEAAHTASLSELLRGLPVGEGRTGAVSRKLSERVQAALGDYPVHVVSREDMQNLLGVRKPPFGYHDPLYKHIVISADTPQAALPHILLHEGLHGLLQDTLSRNATIRGHVEKIMAEAKEALKDEALPYSDQFLTPRPPGSHYGWTDAHEFMSEALSNGVFQRALAKVPLSEGLVRELGLPEFRQNSIWGGVVHTISRMLGLKAHEYSALEAAMAVGERASWDKSPGHKIEYAMRQRQMQSRQQAIKFLPAFEDAADATNEPKKTARAGIELPITQMGNVVNAAIEHTPTVGKLKEWGMKLQTNDQLRQAREWLFGSADESNPLRKLTDTIEKMGVKMRKYREEGDKIARDNFTLSKKYQGPQWDEYARLREESTIYDLHPDKDLDSSANAHLRASKDVANKLAKGRDSEHETAMDVWQSRQKHRELSALYDSLPSDLRRQFRNDRDYYKEMQDKITRSNVDQVLSTVDLPDGVSKSALAERIMNDAMTEDDDKLFADKPELGKAIKNAEELKVKKGAYFPLMRQGEHVVRAKFKVEAPTGGKKIDENTWEFGSRQEANKFAREVGLPARTKTVYYDPETGAKTTKDNESTTGSPVQKFQTRVQRELMELHETERGANARRQELVDHGGFEDIKAVTKRDLNNKLDYEISSPQIQKLVDNLRKRKDLSPEQRGIMERSLLEASIGMKAGTRVEQRRLPRRNVAGASRDVVRNTIDYSNSASRYLSRQDYRSTVDGALKDMREHIKDNEYQDTTIERQRVLQEMEGRLYGFGSPEYTGRMAPVWSRLMTASFLMRMASSAHILLHMTHPGMISAPVLGSRHGFAKAYASLARAYGDMGAMDALKEGAKGAVRTARNPAAEPTNFVDGFKQRLAKSADGAKIGKMLDALMETGHIHPDAGFEATRLNEFGTAADRGLSRVDTAVREITGATESINRVAEAVAAFRLEHERNGGDFDKAVRYAKDTLANTQGLYSPTNAAPAFRNPALRPFLQFKQFPQMVYSLLGKSLYNMFKNEDPKVRAEAVRAFAGVITTHAAMAGALGLPMEVIKAPIMLANALGVTNTSWADIEEKAQEQATEMFGPQVAEVVMHGLSRALGPFSVDVHHRLGLNSLLTFGEPKSNKPEDSMNWILQTVGGAPASMAQDAFTGGQALMNGDFGKAAEHLIPIKQFDDLAKAYRLGSDGKPSARGGGMEPMGAAQMFTQALGFKPASVAKYDEASWAAKKTIRTQGEQNHKLINDWAGARTPGDRARAMARISAYNDTQPAEARITHKMLDHAASKREKASASGNNILGMPVTAQNRAVLQKYRDTFNVQ